MFRPGAKVRSCRLLLLAALPWEVRPFLRQVRARRWPGLGLPAWTFHFGTEQGLVALSGMGREAARDAVQRLLDRELPEIVISLGFGGALSPESAPGSLVLGGSFWEYDPVLTLLSPGPAPAAPRPLPELLDLLAAAGLRVLSGSVVSTPFIVQKKEVGDRLGGLRLPVLDQETAALARAAFSRNLSFLALRAITDADGEEIPDFIVRAGGKVGVGTALGWLAADPGRLKTLVHLWRRSQLAAARLAQALQILLPLLLAPGQDSQDQPTQEG